MNLNILYIVVDEMITFKFNDNILLLSWFNPNTQNLKTYYWSYFQDTFIIKFDKYIMI